MVALAAMQYCDDNRGLLPFVPGDADGSKAFRLLLDRRYVTDKDTLRCPHDEEAQLPGVGGSLEVDRLAGAIGCALITGRTCAQIAARAPLVERALDAGDQGEAGGEGRGHEESDWI